MNDVLDIAGLSLDYSVPHGRLSILEKIDLRVGAGEVVGLVGESGSGKSTLALAVLRHLAGNARITGGKIFFQGEDILAATPARLRAIRGRHIGMVYQDPSAALNPSLRLGEQVAEVLRHHRGLDRQDSEAATADLLATMRLANPRAIMRRFPHEVSGGEKQRVVMAMAMAGDPSLLVMDEPTTALDATTAAGILSLIRELQARRNLGVLYISHDVGNVARIASRIAVIYAGTIVEEGRTQEVLGRPAHVYTRMLLASLPNPIRTDERRRLASFSGLPADLRHAPAGCRFTARCPLAESACAEQPIILAGPESHRTACRRPALAAAIALPLGAQVDMPSLRTRRILLAAGRVSVAYHRRQRPAVAEVTLDLAAGETLGLVGESGSGKSSFARALIGLTASTGEVTFCGQPVATLARRDRRLIQMVFQHPEQSLNPTMRIGESLGRPLRLYDGLTGKKLQRGVAEWLERVRLPAGHATRFPNELSGGEKQRVAIARAFAARPEIVLCDEITTGLDASVQASVLNLLTELQDRNRTALLLISHDLNLVQHFADRIAVMHRGQLVELRTAHGMSPPPFHPYTEALLAAMPVAEPGLSARTVETRQFPYAVQGCGFAGHCPRQPDERCAEAPPIREVSERHWIRCHLPLSTLAAVPPIWSR